MSRFASFLSLALLAPGLSAFAGDSLLVGNKSDDTVWRLSLEDGRRLGEIASAPGPHEIAVAPDGRTAVVTGYGHQQPGNALSVIDLAGDGAVRTIDLGRHARPHGVRLLPDGSALVTTEQSHALLHVDLAGGQVLREYDVGGGLGHMVALSRDGRVAYVSKIVAGTVARVDLASGEVREAAAGKGAEGIEVAPDGTVWVTNRAEDTVTVHDPETLDTLATLESQGFPIRVAFTPDGRHALVTNATAGTLSVFDATSRETRATVALKPEGETFRETLLGQDALPIGVIVDPEKPRAYIAISGANRIAVVDTDSWHMVDAWESGNEPDALGIAREGAQ
jgi:DNA-binding beta-propeller fold protein YncE